MQALNKVVQVLKKGGVVVHATETCYGFACDVFNKKALERLYALKQMPKTKPISIMVDSFKEAQKYGYFSKKARELAQKHWPGPLTLIIRRKKTLPDFFNPGSETIGIRVPDHKLSLALVKKFKKPLTTTSANISKKSSCYSVAAIKKQFVKAKIKPDFYLNSGRIPRNPPSTIIDLSGPKIKIRRQGSLVCSLFACF